MSTWSAFFIGLTMVGLGILGVKYSFWIHNQTGPLDFVERYTGSGTTVLFYKLFFATLIFVGMLWATGFSRNFMEFMLSPLANLFRPVN